MTPAEDTAPLPQRAGAKWSGKTRGGQLGNWIFVTLVRVLGVRSAYLLLVPVSFYFVFFAPTARRASAHYRRRVVARGGPAWLAGTWGAYRHFFSFGQILLDRIAILTQPPGRFQFRFEGEEHLREALSGGRGLLLISGHCGNWEVAAHLLKRYDVAVNIVAFKAEEDYVRRYFKKKVGAPVSVIAMDGTADVSLAIMSALARGEVVAMHADRNLNARSEHAVTVPVLGDPARLPTGPYLVAAASGAPLIHTFAMREGTYRYRFIAYPPEHLSFTDRSSRRERLQDWARQFVAHLEETIAQYPLQWHNFYDFWDDEARLEERPATAPLRRQL